MYIYVHKRNTTYSVFVHTTFLQTAANTNKQTPYAQSDVTNQLIILTYNKYKVEANEKSFHYSLASHRAPSAANMKPSQ